MLLALSFGAVGPARALAQAARCGKGALEVNAVSFSGNKAIPSATLESTIETAPSSTLRRVSRAFGARHCLEQGAILRDAARVMLLYRRKGYPRVVVDTAIEPAGAHAVRVRFGIRENSPTIVDSIEVRGVEDSAMRASLARGIKLRPGDPLDRFSLDASSASMVVGLRRAGYLAASARRGERVDSGAQHAVAWIDVDRGTRVRLGELRIEARGADSGAPRIPEARVERLTRLEPGAILGSQELSEARRGLDAVGLFEEVRITLDSIRSSPSGDGGDGTANVNVSVLEGPPHEVRLRAGYATLDCFRLQLQARRAGIFDRPGHVELTTRLSKVAVGAPLDFAPSVCSSETQADPYSARLNYYVGGTYALASLGRWTRSVSVYTERRSEYLAYLKTTYLGGSASASRAIGRRWRSAFVYDLSYGRTQAEPAVLCATFSACVSSDRDQFTEALPFGLASAVLTFDNTDTPMDPSHGRFFQTELRVAPRWLGTAVRQQIIGGRVNVAAYYPLTPHMVLAARAQGAIVAELPDADFIPQGERLFAGGASTVRGFHQNEVGPRVYLADSIRAVMSGADTVFWSLPPDSTKWRAVPAGGSASAVANLELRIRPSFLASLVQFVAFVDAGNVWARDEPQIDNTALFITPGIGVRISTPIGPIRFDIAANPYRSPTGPAYRDAPVGYANAPLYCVSIGNTLPVTGFGQTDEAGLPLLPTQAEGFCPSAFQPSRPSGFLNRLAIHFSIGQAF